ncbi:MFS transporter [Marinomonas shanghaiensis]|uniref:MFS transporter n=1 Tax=Marinomonas shanghaiensis TaxID=2202418 RepID=UPI000DB9A89A|nr:MFS transporter [Marinomonas shanghaiensis]
MRTSGVLLFVAYLGFISLGLPDAAHGINWPFVRMDFSVPIGWLGLVIAAGGIGYLMSSFSVGYWINRFGVGWLLVTSCLLVSSGLFGFYFSTSFIVFTLFSVVIGMGSGAIDAGLNAYAAEHFSTKHMNWLHAAFGVGATAGPIIVTSVLVSFSQNWRLGYAVLAIILFVMALVFLFSRHLWESEKHAPKKVDVTLGNTGPVTQLQALKHPVIRFQIVFFFLYSGVEVGVGQWAFTVMTESRGISIASAGTWVAVYWGALAFGRAIFGFLVERFSVDQLLRLCLAGVSLGALFFTVSITPYTSYFGLALMGFCAAPIFPCMISQTAIRVGKSYSVHAIGFQMSAAVMGAMTLPFLSGLIGGQFGLTFLSMSFLTYALALFVLFHLILRRAL